MHPLPIILGYHASLHAHYPALPAHYPRISCTLTKKVEFNASKVSECVTNMYTLKPSDQLSLKSFSACTQFHDAVSLSPTYPYTAIVELLKACFTFNHIVQGMLVGNLENLKISVIHEILQSFIVQALYFLCFSIALCTRA